ncbi:MAG: hypothetical protein AAB587_01710 [Patescibacteria group bacterium]
MNFISNFKFTPVNILKAALVILAGFVVITFVLTLVGSVLNPSFRMMKEGLGGVSQMPMTGVTSYDASDGYYGEVMMEEVNTFTRGGMPASLSVRNIAPIFPPQGGTTGNNAEDFEVTEYSAIIETQNRESTCSSVTSLKKFKYVIFESANESDTSCYYSFKVEHARVAEILVFVKNLDPKELSENTYTIKRQLDDFTNETEILEKKRASIDQTLKSAIDAYDEITALAIRTQDVESLAKIIDSKIQIIERLTQERININTQLDYLSRAKAEQLDRLLYTYFNVSVYENRFVDVENIKDSWKTTIKDFVNSINQSLQSATINLIALIFITLPYLIYLFVLLVGAKYGWRLAKYVWKK